MRKRRVCIPLLVGMQHAPTVSLRHCVCQRFLLCSAFTAGGGGRFLYCHCDYSHSLRSMGITLVGCVRQFESQTVTPVRMTSS